MTVFNKLAAALAFTALLVLGSAHGQGAKPVRVEALGDILVDQRFSAPASVVAANRSVLAAEVAARVEAVAHDVGARVERGALLVSLDATDYDLSRDGARASLKASEARIRQAELRLERAQSLAGDGYISEDDLLARQTDLDVLLAERSVAQVALSQAEQAVRRTRIEAPFDGTVVSRQAQVGAYVVPGTPLLTLVQDSALEINAEVDPAQAEFLLGSPQIEFLVRDRRLPARLLRMSGVIDPQTRVQSARLAFAVDTMPAGSTGTLQWLGARGQLPAGLVVQRADRFGIFVAEGTTARFVVLPNAQEGRPVAIGLPDSTRVVTRGADRLQDGDTLVVER